MFKLCWKEYPCKLTNLVGREFKSKTGEDLMCLLQSAHEFWLESAGMSDRNRINSVCSVFDSELAAYAFYYLSKGGGSNAPLAEFEDAVMHVGPYPNNIDDEFTKPWAVVLIDIVEQLEADLTQALKAKKPDTADS